MSNIDLTQIITAEDKAAKAQAARAAVVKADCTRRILDVADQAAQINLAAALAVGALSDTDAATYQGGQMWIHAMRAACKTIIADPALDPAEDANWPTAPDAVVALVARY